jgi:hypothetical protein
MTIKGALFTGTIKVYKKIFASSVGKLLEHRQNFLPKILVKMDGGLGSQMWQYAIGRGAWRMSGLPVFYDLSWFSISSKDINGEYNRNYEIEKVFHHIEVNKANIKDLFVYKLHFDFFPGTRFEYEETMMKSSRACYLGGYYVNAQYIDQQGDSLRDEFLFKLNLSEENKRVLSQIDNTSNSVALHIRRGDYVGSVHDVTTPTYFTNSIQYILGKTSPCKVTFFVFSNDIPWCKNFLSTFEEDFIYVENNDNDNGAFDMYLMSKCSHFIISNSSFSWWAAWLSKRSSEKIVIMPDKWLRNETHSQRLTMRSPGWIIEYC